MSTGQPLGEPLSEQVNSGTAASTGGAGPRHAGESIRNERCKVGPEQLLSDFVGRRGDRRRNARHTPRALAAHDRRRCMLHRRVVGRRARPKVNGGAGETSKNSWALRARGSAGPPAWPTWS